MTDVSTARTPIVTTGTAVDKLAAAHESVRRACGWHVAPIITETLVLEGGGSSLLLPSKRVRTITSVLNDGVEVVDEVEWSVDGRLRRGGGFTPKLRGVQVTLEHGYELTEVADVAALIESLAARVPSGGAIVSQSVGPASVRYATGPDGMPVGLSLLASDIERLAPYRLDWSL